MKVPLPEREALCLERRHRFQKLKHVLMSMIRARGVGACASCGSRSDLVLDHIIPIRWGGTNDEVNLQLLCGACNSAKGGLLPGPPDEVTP